MKKCPFCAEEIQDEAIVCRYCGRELPNSRYYMPPQVQQQQKTDNNTKKSSSNRQLLVGVLVIFMLFLCNSIFNSPAGNAKDKAQPTQTEKISSSVEYRTFTPAADPTRTPRPTDTPGPTKTAGPTVDPYILAMREKFSDYTDVYQLVNKYVQMLPNDMTLLVDKDWKEKTGIALGLLNFRADEMAKPKPSAGYEQFHSYVVEISKETHLFTESFAKGIDNLDSSSLEAAKDHLDKVTATMYLAAIELEDVKDGQ